MIWDALYCRRRPQAQIYVEGCIKATNNIRPTQRSMAIDYLFSCTDSFVPHQLHRSTQRTVPVAAVCWVAPPRRTS
jgi:hypothetical protein